MTSPMDDPESTLRSLGADTNRLQEVAAALVEAPQGAVAGRVARVDRGRFQLMTVEGILSVATAGVSPVGVGDWCVVIGLPDTGGHAEGFAMLRLLTRHSALVRQTSGQRTESQALAANMDTIMVVIPLDRAISPRQVERFLALAWDSGAEPVLVLTKVDLVDVDTATTAVSEVRAVSGNQSVLSVSVVSGEGMSEVAAYVTPGQTVALLGTSGSGKSSLVNALMGAEVVQTGAVRLADSKGRHTTTWRELIVLPTGGTLIDTPGLRELGMWIDEEGIDAAFADITDLADQCRFSDCAHDQEPGCAVINAITNGEVDPERLTSYRKLLAEAAFAARKNDHRLAKEAQKMWKQRTLEGKRNARP
jgi:ribosome biogenesis GTPase / thiamine phosphate phosphatase